MTDMVQQDAQELTHEEHQALVSEAFTLERQVKDGLAAGRVALWATAEALYQFSEVQGWKLLGGYDTLGDWLSDPEIGMTKSTYHRLRDVWQEVVVRREIEPATLKELDPSKVALTLPAVRDGRETMEGALDAAATNGWRDLRERYLVHHTATSGDPDEPTGDGIDEEYTVDVDVPDIPEGGFDEELYGTSTVARGVAQTVTIALEAVMSAHPIERRSMSKELHALGEQALEIAHAEGLGNVS